MMMLGRVGLRRAGCCSLSRASKVSLRHVSTSHGAKARSSRNLLGFAGCVGAALGGSYYLQSEQKETQCSFMPHEAPIRCLEMEEAFKVIVTTLLGKVRDEESDQHVFKIHTDRLLTLVVEVALGQLAMTKKKIRTPTGAEVETFDVDHDQVAAISILRSGDAFMKAFTEAMPGSPTGKLLLVKHANDDGINILYSKLPTNLKDCQVFLMDPMLATGTTMLKAIKVLVQEHKVKPERIIVLSMISCPKGINKVHKEYPMVKIVTAAIDSGFDENGFLSPGLGSFGDRYFGT